MQSQTPALQSTCPSLRLVMIQLSVCSAHLWIHHIEQWCVTLTHLFVLLHLHTTCNVYTVKNLHFPGQYLVQYFKTQRLFSLRMYFIMLTIFYFCLIVIFIYIFTLVLCGSCISFLLYIGTCVFSYLWFFLLLCATTPRQTPCMCKPTYKETCFWFLIIVILEAVVCATVKLYCDNWVDKILGPFEILL